MPKQEQKHYGQAANELSLLVAQRIATLMAWERSADGHRAPIEVSFACWNEIRREIDHLHILQQLVSDACAPWFEPAQATA